MRIALAHDSFTQEGGAERVVETFHELFPESPVYTLVVDKKLRPKFSSWQFRTSLLQRLYDVHTKLEHWLFVIPAAVESLTVEPDIDVLLSSSSSFIKGLRKPKGSVHINYCHTPTRFLWSDSDYVRAEVPIPLRPPVRLFLGWMKKWDLRAASRVDQFIANSKEVQGRIQKYYGRESVVIHPGVDTEFWKPTKATENYFLVAGRLQPYKHIDTVVKVFNELGLPLHVVGEGRQRKQLEAMAKSNITFLGRISDEALRDEYSGAKAFLYPQLEDFGLMPVEAACCGTPTIALGRGGALETVVSGVTGEFFENPDKESIKQVVGSWTQEKYSRQAIITHGQTFSLKVFKQRIREYMEKALS